MSIVKQYLWLISSYSLAPLFASWIMFKVNRTVWAYLGITTWFWEAVTFEYQNTAFPFTWKTSFFPQSASSTMHTYHSDLTKMMVPRPATRLSFFNLNFLVLFTCTLLISFIHQTLASVATVPSRQSWRFCHKKKTNEPNNKDLSP